MAMFASARLALRRSLAAPPRSASLGADLRQATMERSPSRLHGPLLPRRFNSGAPNEHKSEISRKMAMFTSTRLALRRSLAAPPRSASLGADLRQATMERSPSRLHGPLLPRRFNSGAPNENLRPSVSEASPALEIRVEEKKRDLIKSIIDAVDNCELAQKDLALEKYKEAVEHVRHQFTTEGQRNGKSANGSTKPRTGNGDTMSNILDLLAAVSGGGIVGILLLTAGDRLRR